MSGEGHRHTSTGRRNPLLQGVPGRSVDLVAPVLISESSQDGPGLVLTIGQRERDQPRLVLRVQAITRGGHDQAGRALPLDETALQPLRRFLDRLVPNASLAQERADQVRGSVAAHALRFVEDEHAVLQRLVAVGQRPLRHGRESVIRLGREEGEHLLDEVALAGRRGTLHGNGDGPVEQAACAGQEQELAFALHPDSTRTLQIGGKPGQDVGGRGQLAARSPGFVALRALLARRFLVPGDGGGDSRLPPVAEQGPGRRDASRSGP